jgi:hypothetical protein
VCAENSPEDASHGFLAALAECRGQLEKKPKIENQGFAGYLGRTVFNFAADCSIFARSEPEIISLSGRSVMFCGGQAGLGHGAFIAVIRQIQCRAISQ